MDTIIQINTIMKVGSKTIPFKEKANNNPINTSLLEYMLMEKNISVNFNGGSNQNKIITIVIMDFSIAKASLLELQSCQNQQEYIKDNFCLVKNKEKDSISITTI